MIISPEILSKQLEELKKMAGDTENAVTSILLGTHIGNNDAAYYVVILSGEVEKDSLLQQLGFCTESPISDEDFNQMQSGEIYFLKIDQDLGGPHRVTIRKSPFNDIYLDGHENPPKLLND